MSVLNTAYEVRCDILESENNVSIENGTLHVYNNKLKVHLDNQIKTIVTGSDNASEFITCYGSFYDTTTQSPSTSTIHAITLNSTDSACTHGVSIVNNSRIKVDTTGVYNLLFSAQLQRTTGGTSKQAIFWIRVNGVDIPATSTHLTVQANATFLVAAWNFFISMNANDYVELMYWQDDAITIAYDAANVSVPYPSTPSVILTINKIN